MKWDILIMLFSLFNCFSVPIKVCFNPIGMESPLFNVCNIIIDVFFTFDIFISF